MSFNEKVQSYSELLQLCNDIEQFRQKQIESLPYHINVIDAVCGLKGVRDDSKIHETAHSRILARLLQYTPDKKQYPLLKSFFDKAKLQINIYAPSIKIETRNDSEQIDILVDDKDYVVIIENKANDAGFQKDQLWRYYNQITRQQEYRCKDVYIVCLLPKGDEESIADEWCNAARTKSGKPDSIPKEKRRVLKFEDDVIPLLDEWYKESDVRLLRSALKQYSDFLKGWFQLREGDVKMGKEMQSELKRLLGVESGSPGQVRLAIHKKLESLKLFVKELENLKADACFKKAIEKELEELAVDYPNFKRVRGQDLTELSKKSGPAEWGTHWQIAWQYRFNAKDNGELNLIVGFCGLNKKSTKAAYTVVASKWRCEGKKSKKRFEELKAKIGDCFFGSDTPEVLFEGGVGDWDNEEYYIYGTTYNDPNYLFKSADKIIKKLS